MKIYAFIQRGEVAEIIQPATWPDETEIDIKDRFTPEFVAQMVDITDLDPMPGLHWTYENGVFKEPVPIPEE